jgi:hypothetical protein
MSPEVITRLKMIDEAHPKWKNANEQLMALRLLNYDVQAVINWKREEIATGGVEGSLTVADTGKLSCGTIESWHTCITIFIIGNRNPGPMMFI